jgi:hypothetical protein
MRAFPDNYKQEEWSEPVPAIPGFSTAKASFYTLVQLLFDMGLSIRDAKILTNGNRLELALAIENLIGRQSPEWENRAENWDNLQDHRIVEIVRAVHAPHIPIEHRGTSAIALLRLYPDYIIPVPAGEIDALLSRHPMESLMVLLAQGYSNKVVIRYAQTGIDPDLLTSLIGIDTI